uniref:Uncharacterized protein n=1 Tax=Acetithermum autotrophicum TaxID=1446466 RepID=H5SVR8_ACEAU|nr:hypothetical protein HGMM_OP4C337 [Candidatus Acetothermum autotrophicum]
MAKISAKPQIEQLAQMIAKLSPVERQHLCELLATLEEERDPGALKALQESEEDVRQGRLYSFRDIFGDE